MNSCHLYQTTVYSRFAMGIGLGIFVMWTGPITQHLNAYHITDDSTNSPSSVCYIQQEEFDIGFVTVLKVLREPIQSCSQSIKRLKCINLWQYLFEGVVAFHISTVSFNNSCISNS
jgi:hypothetical protein